MILTSLMQGADDDVKAHAASALQTAAVVSDYSEEVLTNISNSCDFSAVIPPLLKSSSHIVQTTSSLLSALLLPITDVSRKTTSTHPSHTIAINLHTSQVINGLMELLLNPSASTPQTTSVLVCLAGITTANRNSDILPTTNLANECMAMLQSTHVHENKQVRAEAKRQQKRDAIYHPATASAITNNARRFAPHPPPQLLQQILTTFAPKGQNPSVALSQLLRVSPPLLSAAHTLIQQYIHDSNISFELLIASLDAGIVNLILNALGTTNNDADDCQNLEMLAILGKISYAHDSPAKEVAKERWEGSIQYYEMVSNVDVVPKLTKFLQLDEGLFDEHTVTKRIKCNIVKVRLDEERRTAGAKRQQKQNSVYPLTSNSSRARFAGAPHPNPFAIRFVHRRQLSKSSPPLQPQPPPRPRSLPT